MKIGNRRPPPAPDAAVIRTLAGLLSETGLTEIEYAVGDTRIRVARESAGTTAPPAPAATNGAAPPQPQPHAAEKPATNGVSHPGAVTSPIVGIAYLAAQPGAPPFVRLGDAVSEGQTLLIIEAMKVMNQIRATRAGRVSQIFVEDAAPVEYGAALMLIE